MKVGLIDVDGHNFPNLALMKISSYHKLQGDCVEWTDYRNRYDKVYMSKVFTFTPDIQVQVQSDEIIRGGTGYNSHDNLFCEFSTPDYSLYPVSKWYDGKTSYGFLTRGCIRNCSWCIVPEKEGRIRPHQDIDSVLHGNKKVILMDNNVLACSYGLQQLERIIDLKCKVDFNQGLDARLVTEEVAKLLSKIHWIRYIRFSCDTSKAVEPLLLAIEKLNKYDVKNYRIFVYLLVKNVDKANLRADLMKKIGIVPFAQPYRDFRNNVEPTKEQKKFARYVNRKEIFNSTDWKNYNSSVRNV